MGISIEQYRCTVGLFHSVHLKDKTLEDIQTGCVHPSSLNNDLQDGSSPKGTSSMQDQNTPVIRGKKCLRNICFRYRPKVVDVHAKPGGRTQIFLVPHAQK